MHQVAIKAQGLSKEYVIGGPKNYHRTFRDLITATATAPIKRFRHLRGAVSNDKQFWALRDLEFEVQVGEVLGIIGRNGAGKSTLLKVLSRITQPSKGRIEIRGNVATLLEVGTGFHPELTGKENIFLNGAILGMARREIQNSFDEIVAFAEVENFLETPVKRYSSGMYVRLAFAVAAHLQADILMVDEVLAVGDSEFQKKCLGKMKDVTSLGRTVIFVSHNMGAISNMCNRCLLLKDGEIDCIGESKDVISRYFDNEINSSTWTFTGVLAEDIVVEQIVVNGDSSSGLVQVAPSDDIEIKVLGRCKEKISDVRVAIFIEVRGIRIFTTMDSHDYTKLDVGKFESTYIIPKYLIRPGEYEIGLAADRKRVGSWLRGENLRQLKIKEEWDINCRKDYKGVLNLESYRIFSSRKHYS